MPLLTVAELRFLLHSVQHHARAEERPLVEAAHRAIVRAELAPAHHREASLKAASEAVLSLEPLFARAITADEIRLPDATIAVPSSSHAGEHHTVLRRNGVYSCSCKGYEYRRRCRHVDAAKKSPAPLDVETAIASLALAWASQWHVNESPRETTLEEFLEWLDGDGVPCEPAMHGTLERAYREAAL